MSTLPILLLGGITEIAKDTQLRRLTEAALEFCEARKFCQREHGVPQRDGFLVTRNARNHRTKKRQPIGWLKRDDRGAHITASAAEGELGLGVELGIPTVVIRSRCIFR